MWDLSRYTGFIHDGTAAPDTVDPSLWRMSQLLMDAGLYEVVPGVYQVREADLSNLTFVEGEQGITIYDPLISAETARAALDLYYQNRPRKPVVAVIYSHSHIDHAGGIRGVVDEADVKSGKAKICAPEGFLENFVAENLFAATAMGRPAAYMYGNLLAPGPQGTVTAGLGVTTSSGTVILIPPTDLITKPGEKRVIDGIEHEFLMTPGSEAPSEMMWYLPSQAESGPWRGFYLTGADELRHGVKKLATGDPASADIIANMSTHLPFGYMGVQLDAKKADGKTLAINWMFPDINEKHALFLENSVLNHWPEYTDAKADVTVTVDRATLTKVLTKLRRRASRFQLGHVGC